MMDFIYLIFLKMFFKIFKMDTLAYIENNFNEESLNYLIYMYLSKNADVNYRKDGKSIITILIEKYTDEEPEEFVLIFLIRFLLFGFILENEELYDDKISQYCTNFLNSENKKQFYRNNDIIKFLKLKNKNYYAVTNSALFVYSYLADDFETCKEHIFSNLINKYEKNVALKTESTYLTRNNEEDVLYESYICTLDELMHICKDIENEEYDELIMNIFENLLLKLKCLNAIGIIHLNLNLKNIAIMSDCTVRIFGFSKSIFLGVNDNQLYENISNKYYINGELMMEYKNIPISYSTDSYYLAGCLYQMIFGLKKFVNIIPLYDKTYEDEKGELVVCINMKVIPHLEDFIRNCTKNYQRFTIKDALQHPLFGGRKSVIDRNSITTYLGNKIDIKKITYLEEFLTYHMKDKLTIKYGIQEELIARIGIDSDLFTFRNIYQLMQTMKKDENILNSLCLNLKNFFRGIKIKDITGLKYIKDIKFIPIFYGDIINAYISFLRYNHYVPAFIYRNFQFDLKLLSFEDLEFNLIEEMHNDFYNLYRKLMNLKEKEDRQIVINLNDISSVYE